MIQSNPSFQAVWERMSDDELRALGPRYRELSRELAASGELIASEGLGDVALTRRVTVRDGRTVVSDGPMAEAKEHLAGFYLVDCTAERAVEIAARIPDATWTELLIRPINPEPPTPATGTGGVAEVGGSGSRGSSGDSAVAGPAEGAGDEAIPPGAGAEAPER
jgi:hypothetical protein